MSENKRFVKDARYMSISEREGDALVRPTSDYSGYGDDFGIYHPLSYYVLGGVDVDGSELRTDASIMFDDSKDIENGCGVDATCDPRVSYFDVVEQLGVAVANSASENSPNLVPSPSADE